MKIGHFLLSGILLASFVGSPALATETTGTEVKRNSKKQELNQIKKEVAACRARALEKYLSADKVALEAFNAAKKSTLETYTAALKKAKETKIKEERMVARKTLESARTNAKKNWQAAHKKILDTWKTEREACKAART